MSLEHFRANKRRILRLEAHFEPYSHLRLNTTILRDHAIEVHAPKNRSKRRYRVDVDLRLLSERAPLWIDVALLGFARRYVHAIEHESESPEQDARAAAYCDELFQFFEKIKSETIERPNEGSELGLEELWRKIRLEYFPEQAEIDHYSVVWSKRDHRSALASCNVDRQRVQVAGAMNLPDSRPLLEPLLYHEMCHAALGQPQVVNGRRIMHGKEFKALEKRHPQIEALNNWITAGGWEQAVRDYQKRS